MGKPNLDKLRKIKLHRVLGIRDTGRRVNVRCPLHNDRTPSLSIYPDGSYYCFGCGQHGTNPIDFLQQLGATMPEIVEELSKYE